MRKKGIWIIMTTLIAACSSMLIWANSGSFQSIEVLIGHVTLVVNGQPADNATILYNGTTYIPLREAAEILGKEVRWDEENAVAHIMNPPETTRNIENLGKGTLEEPYVAGDVVLLSTPEGNEYEIFFDTKLDEQTAMALGEKADFKYFSHNFYENETLFMAKINVKELTVSTAEESLSSYMFNPYNFDGSELNLEHKGLLSPVKPSYYSGYQDYFWIQSVIEKDSPVLIGFDDPYYGLIYFDLN